MGQRKIEALLERNRQGSWIVLVRYPDGSKVIAEPGAKNVVVYDHPERVPRHLKQNVIPGLVAEARQRNLRGE